MQALAAEPGASGPGHCKKIKRQPQADEQYELNEKHWKDLRIAITNLQKNNRSRTNVTLKGNTTTDTNLMNAGTKITTTNSGGTNSNKPRVIILQTSN